MEQLHSSEVIAKDTSSVTMFDSILPGALESASAGKAPAPAPAPARGRGARGGQMRRAGGARGPTPFQVVHFSEDNDVNLFVILPEGWKPTNFFNSYYLPEGWKQKTMN